MPKLALAANPKYVTAIFCGTIMATTVENIWFGLAKDRRITIHVLAVDSKLQALPLPSDDPQTTWHAFDGQVQEIIDSMLLPANLEVVKTRMLPLLWKM